MARQKLIHLHTTGLTATNIELLSGPASLELGEIAVQHNENDTKMYVRLSDYQTGAAANKLGTFITESAVDAKITSAVTSINSSIDTINQKIGSGFSETSITSAVSSLEGSVSDLTGDLADETAERVSAVTDVQSAIDAEETRAKAAESGLTTSVTNLQSEVNGITSQLVGIPAEEGAVKTYVDNAVAGLSGVLNGVSAATPASDYVTVTVSAKDAQLNQGIGVSVDVVGVSASTAAKQGLADAYDVKQELSARDTTISGIQGDVTDIQSQLSGFSTTAGSVKSYVDDSISSAISSVYKVKGSVQTYAELPTGATEGDVWNVESACVVDDKSYPAGTNWVWVDGEPSGHWDPLGGTIDLTPYMQISDFNTYSAATNTRIGGVETNVTTVSGQVATETSRATSAETSLNTRLTAVEESIGSGSTAEKIAALESGLANEITARTDADTTLSGRIDNVASDITDLQSSASTLDSKIDSEISARTDADTALGTRIDNEATARGNADNAINAQIGSGFSSANTIASAITSLTSATSTLRSDVDGINAEIGQGFDSTNTVAAAISALQTNGIQSVVVDNTATNHITASKSGTTVTLNFDEMVIDCGEYGV